MHNLKKKKIVAFIIGPTLYKGLNDLQGFGFREVTKLIDMIETDEEISSPPFSNMLHSIGRLVRVSLSCGKIRTFMY